MFNLGDFMKPSSWRFSLLTFAFALLSLGLWAQNCSSVVIDGAGIIQNPSSVEKAARPLIDQGADVHVVTLSNIRAFGSRLQDVEDAYERRCPNWTAPNGIRKANLMVVMLAPHERLKNVFYGSAYNGVFSGANGIDTLYSKYANPFFSKQQWDDGFAAAMMGLNNRVAA
jgi:hypothetical protein